MSATTSWALPIQEWQEEMESLKPFRLYKIYPDGERIAEWDRRRGVPLTESQRNTMGAAHRLVDEMIWPGTPMDQPLLVRSPKGHTVRVIPAKGKQPPIIRVGLSEGSVDGWMQVDLSHQWDR